MATCWTLPVINLANNRARPCLGPLLRDAHPCMFGHLAASTSPSKHVVIFSEWHDLKIGQQPRQVTWRPENKHTLPPQTTGRKRMRHTEAEWSAEKVVTKQESERGRDLFWVTEKVNTELLRQPFAVLLSFNHARRTTLCKHHLRSNKLL